MTGTRAERKLALITGASAGLGVEFARQLAAQDYDVVLVARRQDRLEALAVELAAKHGINAYALPCDLARMDARDVVMSGLVARLPGRSPDMLVNNAGFSIPALFAKTDWQRESEMIMTLVHAVCSLTHAALPGMLAKGAGRIINVASVAGFAPGVAGHTLYPAAKSFVIKFTQSLDAELRDKGIQVTALCPGYTRTEFQQASGMDKLAAKARRTDGDDPADVVREALAANAAGRVIVVTGWRNRLSRFALKVLPEALTRPLINKAAAGYREAD